MPNCHTCGTDMTFHDRRRKNVGSMLTLLVHVYACDECGDRYIEVKGETIA